MHDEFSYLSFRMPERLFTGHAMRPAFGYHAGHGNTLGEYVWISKYARTKADGTRERFHEGLRRVIEGMFSIQKDYCAEHRLPWDEAKAQESAAEAYLLAMNGKWSPPGRGLWMMGTRLVNERKDSSALQNCAMISTVPCNGDAVLPYTRAMDMSMMGVGVGFDTKGAGKVTLRDPGDPFYFPVPDSREGWVASVGHLLDAYFTGSAWPRFDYSLIRPAGAPIKGFGGIAAGPAPLKKGHNQLTNLLKNRRGQKLTTTDVVDIMNIIGKLVVSGNVRRSAQIALGDPEDEDFLSLKDWEVHPERMGRDGWGHLSNNSVIAKPRQDLSHLVPQIVKNGEPGVIWLETMQRFGRLKDTPDWRDHRVAGVNPCGEQPLESHECCTLVEVFPSNCDNLTDFFRALKYAFMYAKTVTLLPTQWAESNAVMLRNRRIGTSLTGLAQFVETRGWDTLADWQDAGYAEICRLDKVYSEWLGVRESVKKTTIKPSGSVSLLFKGVTPGAHWPKERGYFVRTLREIKGGIIARMFEAAGYPVEDSVSDPDTTVVITVPVEGPDIRPEREVSLWEKVALAAACQRDWSDNAVSVTVTFRKDEEGQIPAVLRAFDGQLKSVSFLPDSEGVYAQAPYQRVTKEAWDALRARTSTVRWDLIYENQELPEASGELYCTTDACEIPRR